MSLGALWTFLAISLPMLAALLAPMSTVDLTYHLRAGAEMAASGSIPTVDTWTFTAAGEPWFDQQWGAQVILRGDRGDRRLDGPGHAAGGPDRGRSSARCSASPGVEASTPGPPRC